MSESYRVVLISGPGLAEEERRASSLASFGDDGTRPISLYSVLYWIQALTTTGHWVESKGAKGQGQAVAPGALFAPISASPAPSSGLALWLHTPNQRIFASQGQRRKRKLAGRR